MNDQDLIAEARDLVERSHPSWSSKGSGGWVVAQIADALELALERERRMLEGITPGPKSVRRPRSTKGS